MSDIDRPGWPARRLLITGAKLLVTVVVLYSVTGALRDAVAGLRQSPLRPAWPTAVLCAVVYVLGLLPMAIYWRLVLLAWRQPVPLLLTVRGYYLGHLGKYAPGKAMVVVLRTSLLCAAGGRAAPVAASVFVETLTFMAVGGVLSGVLLLAPALAGQTSPWMVALAFLLAALSSTPTLPPVMNRLIAFTSRRSAEPAQQPHPFTWQLFAVGWLAALATWAVLAISLWLAVAAFSPHFGFTPHNLLTCLLAVSLPVVAGFASLIPGGLLVRDGLMVALLAPAAGPELALAATVLVRLGWLAAEAILCVILEVATRVRGKANPR